MARVIQTVVFLCILILFQRVICKEIPIPNFNEQLKESISQLFDGYVNVIQDGRQSKAQYSYNPRSPQHNLRETDASVQKKDSESQEMEESHKEKIMSGHNDPVNTEKEISSQMQDFKFQDNSGKNVQLSHFSFNQLSYGINPIKTATIVKRQIGPPPTPPPSPPFTNQCFVTSSCHINRGKPTPLCYCDTLCHLYKDCCFDIYNYSEQEERDFLQDHYQLKPYTICQGKMYRIFGVHMVYMCPENFKDTSISQKCYDLFNFIPGTDIRNVSFRNTFCAVCHSGVKTITPWSLALKKSEIVQCTNLDNWDLFKISSMAIQNFSLFLNSSCFYLFYLQKNSSILPRMCIPEQTLNLPYPIDSECRNYMNPGLHLQTFDVFKNVQCLPNDIRNKTMCIQMETEHNWVTSSSSDINDKIIFNFGTLSIENQEMSCEDGYKLDKDRGICFPYFCEPDDGRKCYYDFTVKNTLHIMKMFGITNSTIDNNSYILRAVLALVTVLPIEGFQFELSFQSCDLYCIGKVNWLEGACSSDFCCGFDLNFIIHVTSQHSISELLNLDKIQKIVWSYSERNYNNGNIITTRFKGDRQIVTGAPLFKQKIDFNSISINEIKQKVKGVKLNTFYISDNMEIRATTSFDNHNKLQQFIITDVNLNERYTNEASTATQYVFNIIVVLLCGTVAI